MDVRRPGSSRRCVWETADVSSWHGWALQVAQGWPSQNRLVAWARMVSGEHVAEIGTDIAGSVAFGWSGLISQDDRG